MTEKKFNWTKEVYLAAKGDQTAWDALFRATYRNAYFVALKVLGNEEDAMDLVQDAYVTAIENLGSLREPEKFQSWLNMIVANKCRDQLRKKKPALFSEMLSEDGEEPEWVDDRENIRPDVVLDQAETVRLVAEIIDGLPEDQKLCVTLFYRDELSVGQIAQALEASEGTVKSRLNYARKKIKGKVEELEKQGVKLYGIAPIPFFIWLLKNGAEDVAIPSSAASLSVADKVAASGAAKSVAVSGGQAGAAMGAKAGATAVVTKAIACVAAAAVALGGAYVYAKGHDVPNRNEVAQMETPLYTETFPQMDPSSPMEAPTEESVRPEDDAAGTPQASANAEAMEAYYALLRYGYTDSGMPIKYYAFLDIDQNGVNELIAADNAGTSETMTTCHLYMFENGNLKRCGETGAYYDHLYYVNGAYIQGAGRMGCQFLSTVEYISTTIYHLNEDGTRNDPAILRNHGDWKYISQEEFDYYNCRDKDCDGADCFVKSSEIITLLENEFVERNILEETLVFSKCWSIPIEIEDGSTPITPTPELPYGEKTYFVSFHLYEGGGLELLFYKPYTDIYDGYEGAYTVRDDQVELTYLYNDIKHQISYQFDADKLVLTQLSDSGILDFDKKGMEFQLMPDPFMDTESHHKLVDLSLSRPNNGYGSVE